jgi:hypothetical protein
MLYHKPYIITMSAMLLVWLSTESCSTGINSGSKKFIAPINEDAVRAVPIPIGRVPLYKTNVLPAGDVIKRWRWDTPWEVTNSGGSIIRRMYSPDSMGGTAPTDGPHITLIQDPTRGTIYEAYFMQRTHRVFDLPMTLFFFATGESETPLFSFSFTDSAIDRCQVGRVSRGNIQFPGVPQVVFEAAQWVGIGWQSTPSRPC